MATLERNGLVSASAGEKVLVTGASGYIGSAVVRRLLKDGVPVVATARGRTDRLSGELATPVSRLDVMEKLPPFDGIGTIVHCATPNDIMSREADGGIPLAVMGTRALLEHAVRHGVRRLVYLSTLQVYGTELFGTVNEDTAVCCETAYGLNHYLGEEVCRYYARVHGMDIAVLRPANVYGVPAVSTVDRWTLVPMCFVREALKTGAVELRSSGRQQRNFISTQEVADQIAALLMHFPPGFSITNVASDWYSSIVDIAGLVAEAWQREKGQPLALQVLSDQPAQGNDFTILSRSGFPRLAPEASRQQMINVIEGLLRFDRGH